MTEICKNNIQLIQHKNEWNLTCKSNLYVYTVNFLQRNILNGNHFNICKIRDNDNFLIIKDIFDLYYHKSSIMFQLYI